MKIYTAIVQDDDTGEILMKCESAELQTVMDELFRYHQDNEEIINPEDLPF